MHSILYYIMCVYIHEYIFAPEWRTWRFYIGFSSMAIYTASCSQTLYMLALMAVSDWAGGRGECPGPLGLKHSRSHWNTSAAWAPKGVLFYTVHNICRLQRYLHKISSKFAYPVSAFSDFSCLLRSHCIWGSSMHSRTKFPKLPVYRIKSNKILDLWFVV